MRFDGLWRSEHGDHQHATIIHIGFLAHLRFVGGYDGPEILPWER